jgi:peptide/nickel transport system substrate-binding protein
MRNPSGDARMAAEYFRAAGYSSGKFEGTSPILIVGDISEPARSHALVAEQQFRKLGFKTKLRLFSSNTVLTKFCGIPNSGVHVCASVGWARDFADPQTVLDPTFNGDNIREAGNVNWPELDVQALDTRMNRAKLITDPEDRAHEWADINWQVVALAPGIPYLWDYQPVLSSADVRGVQNAFTASWDLSFTSLR